MKVKFYATLRRIVGGKAAEIRLEAGDTVRSVLLRLTEQFPALKPEVWSSAGQLTDYVHVFVNGREVKYLPNRLETVLQEKDVLDVFPPVAGGAPLASRNLDSLEAKMNCPRCNSAMEKVTYQSIEVDRCANCQGLWFDLLEHKRLKELRGSEAIDIGNKAGKQPNATQAINCPKCQTQMTRLVDVKQAHLWYESCPVCHGVFFDAGEFRDYKEETILERFRGLVA